jgi:hypothetical protein
MSEGWASLAYTPFGCGTPVSVGDSSKVPGTVPKEVGFGAMVLGHGEETNET